MAFRLELYPARVVCSQASFVEYPPACTYPSLTVGYLDAWFSSGRLEDASPTLVGFIWRSYRVPAFHTGHVRRVHPICGWVLSIGWICLRGFGAGWKLFLAASLLSRWPVYVRSGEWLYVRLSGVRRVCSGTEPQIWAPENDVLCSTRCVRSGSSGVTTAMP